MSKTNPLSVMKCPFWGGSAARCSWGGRMQLCDMFLSSRRKKGKSTASPPVQCASKEMYNLKRGMALTCRHEAFTEVQMGFLTVLRLHAGSAVKGQSGSHQHLWHCSLNTRIRDMALINGTLVPVIWKEEEEIDIDAHTHMRFHVELSVKFQLQSLEWKHVRLWGEINFMCVICTHWCGRQLF